MIVRVRGHQQEADGQHHKGRCQTSVSVPAFASLVFCHLLYLRSVELFVCRRCLSEEYVPVALTKPLSLLSR